ncbi:MAG: hypothetical protein NZ898_06090 [Myxococcota bacterium]|nr:hypothetical protein [Myxococcota bacterium]MDW8362182.1 hypothetical protein [Myxococcales bacterium]
MRLGGLGLLAFALSACAKEPVRTQVMVSVDAEAGVRARARSLVVRVYGGPRASLGVPAQLAEEFPFPVSASEGWPRVVALAPLRNDPTRIYRVVAQAFDGPAGGGELVAEVSAISGYLRGRVLWLRLLLQDACIGMRCDSPELTCRDGACASARRDPGELPSWMGDAGAGGMDEGGVDAASDVTIDARDADRLDAGLDGSDGGCTATSCDDGRPCNGIERCVGGVCVPGDPPDCADAFDCTIDVCDDEMGGCVHVPNHAACTAGPGGRCEPATGCQYELCTPATCRDEPGACLRARCEGSRCIRESTCGAMQQCCAGRCVARDCDDGNPCTTDSCDAVMGCRHEPNAFPCEDGDACTVMDACVMGRCLGMSRSCDDGNPCTDDRCDGTRGCTHTNNASACNDGDACTTGDRCRDGRCEGTPRPCMDAHACTHDRCVGGSCVHEPDSSRCPPGQMCSPTAGCTTTDRCAGVDCNDGNVCTDDFCDPATGRCSSVPNADSCDDGNRCTVMDVCVDGECTGRPMPCDDGNPCTDDDCNPTTGMCRHRANTSSCDDGDPCTLGERCSSGTCGGGSMRDCSDGIACTRDFCYFGVCMNVPDHERCRDGNSCTDDLCMLPRGCVYVFVCADAGPPPFDGGSIGHDGGPPPPMRDDGGV